MFGMDCSKFENAQDLSFLIVDPKGELTKVIKKSLPEDMEIKEIETKSL